MTRFYLNGKEVSKGVFEKRYVRWDVNWVIETMELNGVKEETIIGRYYDICKIVID